MSAIGVDFCSCISRQTHHHRSNTCPCLLKGSVSAAERPRTLRRLRHVYSPAANCNNEMGSGAEPSCNSNIITDHQSHHHHHHQQQQTQNHQSSGTTENERDEKSLGVMSPFDEQEEWAKISEIMATFGTGLVRESVFVSELEREFQNRLCMNADGTSPYSTTLVGQWLSKLNLADYESLFVNYGFDDLEFINGVLDESDLKDMGIGSEQERATILKAVASLDNRVEKRPAGQSRSVDEWLKSIHLDNYAELFRRHLYTDMDRVRRVWEVELAAVLEIQKPAHRKRILASVSGGSTVAAPVNATSTLGRHTKVSSSGVIVNGRNGLGNGPNLDDLNKDLNALKSNIQQLKDEIREKLPESVQTNGLPSPMSTAASSLTTTTTTTTTATTTVNSTNPTGTLKARKNRPAPPPPQRPPPAQPVQQNGSHNHHPQQTLPQQQQQPAEQLEIRGPSELLFGVPSTLKTQWRHQPKDLVTGCVTYVANYLGSTVVKELRGTESTKKSIQKLKKINRDPRGTPDITLAISYRGVRFLNTLTDEPICEHEIRNIHCACQDADDLTHFAYITKDHASRTHFCHVFCVPTMDQATEIILTLGQAFEVAYQIALKDKLGNQTVRSQSANQLSSLASSTSKSSTTATVKTVSSPTASKHNNDYRNNETNNHHNTNTNPRSKTRSKSITNPFVTVISSNSNSGLSLPQQSSNRNPSPSKTLSNFNSHSNPNGNFSSFESNSKSTNGTNPTTVKFLSTHGRSHSVNEIKINGNQLKLAPAPVDDINIGGVRDMKAGSRAPIALTDEL